jgi:hypothetical protein
MDLIPVKKSTLATWCRDVQLTEAQIGAIKRRTGENTSTPDTQRRRRLEIAEIRNAARAAVVHLASDPLWVAGVVLYWGEGGKSRNDMKLANADPRALRLFVLWVRTYLDPAAEFSLHLHLHEGYDDDAARECGGMPSDFRMPTSTRPSSNPKEQGIERTPCHMACAASKYDAVQMRGKRPRRGSMQSPTRLGLDSVLN